DVHSTRGVARLLRRSIEPDDLLFPYAVPFLRALPQARKARALPRADARTLLATIGHPRAVPTLWITLPIGPRDLLKPDAARTLRRSYPVTVLTNWLVVRVPGPLSGRARVVAALDRAVDAAYAAIVPRDPVSRGYKAITKAAVDAANRDVADDGRTN